MSKKIVAIGGGTIGEYNGNGQRFPYETEPMDREIIRLSDCIKPNILFVGLADIQYSKIYFELINEVFGTRYNCLCKNLSADDLTDERKINEYFDWADIIYVGGGNTYTLMKNLEQYGIDEKLRESYDQGKVMSGLSAGGMCWFDYGNSVIPTSPPQKLKLIKQKCLGLQHAVFAPHADEINGHFENIENLLNGESIVGISLSNCAAIEIVDDKYRIIISQSDRYKIRPFGIKSFWYNGTYITENIEIDGVYRNLEELLRQEPNDSQVRADVKSLLKRRNIYFNRE